MCGELFLAVLAGCTPPEPGFDVSFGTAAPADPALDGGGPGAPTLEPPDAAAAGAWRGGWREPTRIAFDAVAGELLVTDPRGGTVVVCGPDGAIREVVPVGGRPLAIGADPGGERVWVGDRDGTLRAYDRGWGVLVEVPHAVARPLDLAVDPGSGRVFVTDGPADRVAVFDRDGRALGAFGADVLSFPTGITLDADRVWVASQGTRQIVSFGRDGAWRGAFGDPGEEPGELYLPQGLAVDAAGRVWVADARLGRVTAFDPGGAPLGQVGDVGAAPGQLRIPSDVVFVGAEMLVPSPDNQRIERFTVDLAPAPPTSGSSTHPPAIAAQDAAERPAQRGSATRRAHPPDRRRPAAPGAPTTRRRSLAAGAAPSVPAARGPAGARLPDDTADTGQGERLGCSIAPRAPLGLALAALAAARRRRSR